MTRRRRPILAAEHDWHACQLPEPPPLDTAANTWTCPICHQHWIWRRPPRPPAQWIRAQHEEAKHL